MLFNNLKKKPEENNNKEICKIFPRNIFNSVLEDYCMALWEQWDGNFWTPMHPFGTNHIIHEVLKPYYLVRGDGISVASQKIKSNSFTKQDCTAYPRLKSKFVLLYLVMK